MIPILYEANETEFISNGLGRLSDAMSLTSKLERNGVTEITMTYPIDGIHAEELTANRIIYAMPESGKKAQPFIIRDIEKGLSKQIQVTARHRTYDLSYYACMSFGQTAVVPYQVTPMLYDSNSAYIGTLTDLTRYEVIESSTQWNMTLIYPSSCSLSSYLVTGNYIYAQPYIGRDMRLFLITAVSSGTSKTVMASCNIADDPPREFNQMNVSQALGYIKTYTEEIQHCPFEFYADPVEPGDEWATSLKEYWNETPTSVREMLMDGDGKILSTFGGEWEFDNYRCILHEQRGHDNGIQYRYGKNISDISERINIDSLYTNAFSYWKGTASSSTNTQEGEYYVKRGTMFRALDPQYSKMFPTMRVQVIDASSEFEQEPTTEELDAYTQQYIENNQVGVPTVTIDVSVVDLSSTTEYEDIVALETVNLCDTVTVVFPEFGVDIKAKVTAIEYDVLAERNSKVTIGKTDVTLSDVIAENKHDIKKTKVDLQRWADHMAERATEATSGWYGGNIRKNYNANDHKQQSMYIMDTDDENTASKAIKLDGNGLGVSIGGTRGAYKQVIDLRSGIVYFGGSYWILNNNAVYINAIDAYFSGSVSIQGTNVRDVLSDHESRISALEQQI